jgi:hypothetical protein
MRTVRAAIGSAAVMMLMLASSAMGESRTHTLRGDFAITGSGVCVNSIQGANGAPPLGFTVDFLPIGFTFVNTNTVQGVLTFNGDGTGTAVLRFVSMGNPGSAGAFDTTYPFEYSVAADGVLQIVEGVAHSITVAGPSAGIGQQVTISAGRMFGGRVSIDRKSISFATLIPAIETVTRVSPLPEAVTTVRMCHRHRVGFRISRSPGSGGQDED